MENDIAPVQLLKQGFCSFAGGFELDEGSSQIGIRSREPVSLPQPNLFNCLQMWLNPEPDTLLTS